MKMTMEKSASGFTLGKGRSGGLTPTPPGSTAG